MARPNPDIGVLPDPVHEESPASYHDTPVRGPQIREPLGVDPPYADPPYRGLVEQMREGAVVLAAAGDIQYANAYFAALVGESPESILGRRLELFVNPSDRAEFDSLLRAGTGTCRSRLVGADSTVVEVVLSLAPSTWPHGECLSLIVTDLSALFEAHRSRDRAERDSRAKDEFLATLAHELRNPVGAISLAVRVLEATHAEGERAAHAHDVITRQVRHMVHLIDDLLDVERVVSGRLRLDRLPLDMANAVRRAIATFSDDIRLDRHFEIEIDPVWIEGDAVRIEQILINILTNAVKYTPAGARIRVSLRADGDAAVLTVEDTGFGISPRLLPFIFDMYVQADRTIDRAQGGLGIGLTLVRQLVQLHGGTIVASSDGEGRGSTFTITLRRIPAAVSADMPSRRDRRAGLRAEPFT